MSFEEESLEEELKRLMGEEERKEGREKPREEAGSREPSEPAEQATEQATAAEAVKVAEGTKAEEAEAEEAPRYEFVVEEEQSPPAKEVYLVFGEKGSGKTTLALSFPGEIVCLSFDRKSAIIKTSRYGNDRRIHVFDVVKYMDYSSPSKVTESAAKTFEFVNAVLDYAAMNIRPDWIVIDGAEIFHQVCEWTMRHRHGIEAFAGISNLNLWKERRLYIRQIHNKALNVARRGVIYTTYTDKDEIVVQGELVTKKDVPKWIDVLVFETDYVIKCEMDPVNRKFLAKVVTSKDDGRLPTGRVYDVTDKGFWEVVSE